ncbi:hypothetical protein [Streptomyces bluensis]|uniref:hypothetical protein n=1 Tax=Streptomyces bluensis TaxID=33897 RepID=UPI0033303560
MLEFADVRDGDKVLEIGTGTGYSTASLYLRLGDQAAYSVEYDEALATAAAQHLQAAGRAPHLVVGDGLRGHPDGAVIATCAVRTIPPSWLWQLRDGGSITTTLSGWMLASGLIRLTLDDEGIARRRFIGDTSRTCSRAPTNAPAPPSTHTPAPLGKGGLSSQRLILVVEGQWLVVGVRRPSKAIWKAFRGAFQRIVQRRRPLPVGSRLISAM